MKIKSGSVDPHPDIFFVNKGPGAFIMFSRNEIEYFSYYHVNKQMSLLTGKISLKEVKTHHVSCTVQSPFLSVILPESSQLRSITYFNQNANNLNHYTVLKSQYCT
jgi:hypothetical protein